ncbi:hypothetical protein Pmani_035923 [Petrolisthes manimaculis]|uniref:DNA-directed RNA polymerase n=1 Tax=Petrolisthes manimaculis TaxID=1843537 RepID=A0AAE1NJT5_9EUCA|nr:hypothetical protein Pmani_035923 [Petrolisthes manimaculis]
MKTVTQLQQIVENFAKNHWSPGMTFLDTDWSCPPAILPQLRQALDRFLRRATTITCPEKRNIRLRYALSFLAPTLIKSLPADSNILQMMKAGSKKRPEKVVMGAIAAGQLNIFDMFPAKQLDGQRVLPYFSLDDTGPLCEGFIYSSIESGLTQGDILLMSQVKRNNVDKKHNASERSGYLQRKLTKLLEDVTMRHDGTVRDSKD